MDVAGAERYIIDRLSRELPACCRYHSVRHTLDTVRDAEEFGAASGLSAAEMDVLRLAALFHDTGHLVSPDDHERRSADLARDVLPKFGCDAATIESIAELILATRMPCRPRTPLAELLCDADLGNLGTDRFWTCNAQVREELACAGQMFTDREWLEKQQAFLGRFHYFSAAARTRRGAKLNENLAELKRRLEAYQ